MISIAVQQRRRDRVEQVRGGEEDDLGEVDLDVEVVVAEGVVLGRVEHLEQRRRGVAAPVGADLVDLVEQDHRVHRLGVAQGADDPSRQGADVGAAVAADLGLVVEAAEADADELAPEAAGDRLADRGLAGAGRPDQGQDRAVGAAVLLDAALLAQLADGDELGDPSLHVVEPGVVGVEHLARVGGVEPLLGALAPTAPRSASRGSCGSSRTRATARPGARAGAAPSRPARRPPPASRPRRSCARTRRSGLASSSPSSLRIDSICLRRKYSRCCFWAPDSTSSRMRLRTCSSARRSRCSSTATRGAR